MSYAPASALKVVTVAVIDLTFGIDVSWAVPGDTVHFMGRLTADGVGYAGESITIRLWSDYLMQWGDMVSGITDVDGYYDISYTVPWVTGEIGKGWTFQAIHYASYKMSDSSTLTVAYPTRISISSASLVKPGQSFTVSGLLEYESYPGTWEPLGGQTVEVFYNGTLAGSAITSAGGYYDASCIIPTSGSYTLTSSYGGAGLPVILAPSQGTSPIGVGVGLTSWQWALIIGIPSALVVYFVVSKKK